MQKSECVAACCCVLQCVAVRHVRLGMSRRRECRRVSVLQRVAV